MNEEQVKSAVRWVIATFGGMLAGFFGAKGWFTVDQVTTVLNSPTFIGIATSIAAGIWGLFVHKQSNAVAVVAAIAADPASPVKGVVVEPTAEGRALAYDISNSDERAVIVPAGTSAAANIARTPDQGGKK